MRITAILEVMPYSLVEISKTLPDYTA